MRTEASLRFPDFLIVGAAKSGTTSLWKYLGQHPNIFMTKRIEHKELGYFSDMYGVSDKAKYLSFFKDAEQNQLIGEACHAYLTSPESPNNIFLANPKCKIIIVLRNPIERAYSLYNWMASNGYEYINSFEKAIIAEEKRINNQHFIKNCPHYYYNYLYLNSGLYHPQVKRYIDTFGLENCHFISYLDFSNDPLKEVNSCLGFLNLTSLHKLNLKKENEGKSVKFASLAYFLRFKFNYLNFIPFATIRNKIKQCLHNINKTQYKLIKNKTYNRLLFFYNEDIEKTEKIIKKKIV